MAQLFANNAYGKLAEASDEVDTSLVLEYGNGARFPSPTGGDYFLLTLAAITDGQESAWEIVKCTARVGDTLTVTRAQEGTTASAWLAGTKCELRVTAGSLAAMVAAPQTTTIVEWNGVDTAFDSRTSTDYAIAELSAGVFLVVYAAGSAVYARVVTVSGTTAMVGAEQTLIASFAGYTTNSLSLAALSATSAVLGYRDGNGDGSVRALSISGGNVTTGSESVVSAGRSASGRPYLIKMDSTKFVVAYTAPAANVIVFRAYTVSGTTLTAGTTNNYSVTGPSNLAINRTATDRLLAVFATSGGTWSFAPISLSGTTITVGTKTDYTPVSTSSVLLHLVQQGSAFVAIGWATTSLYCDTFTGADTTWSYAGGAQCSTAYPLNSTVTPTLVVQHGSGRGFSLGGRYGSSPYLSAITQSYDYQGVPIKVRDSGGGFQGNYAINAFGGTGASKLCVYKNASGASSCRVLQERLI